VLERENLQGKGKLQNGFTTLLERFQHTWTDLRWHGISRQIQAILILVAIVFFISRYYIIADPHDSQVMLLSLAPVVLAGYFFGQRWGLVTSLVVIGLHFSLFHLEGGQDFFELIGNGGIWGFVALLTAGMGIGRLSDLRKELKRELDSYKRSEQSLQVNLEIDRQSVGNSPNAIFSIDQSGKIQSWNQACSETLQYGDEILGEAYQDLLWDETSRIKIEERLVEVFERGSSYNDLELSYRSKNGSRRFMLSRLYPLMKDDGFVQGGVIANTDITERVQAEQELEQSRERYRSLFEGVPVGLYRTTPDGKILDASPSLVEMLGYANLESLQSISAGHIYVNPNDRDKESQLLERTGMVRDFDLQLRRSDGTAIWARDSVRAVRNGDGEVLYYEGSLEDISLRKRAEEAERQQRILSEALRDVAAALNSTLRFDGVLDRILTNIGRVVPHDAALIMLVEAGSAYPVRVQGYEAGGPSTTGPVARLVIADTPTLCKMSETKQPLVIPDTRNHPGWVDFPQSRWLRSYAGAPILIKGETVGFINLNSATEGFFSDEHGERLKAFADQAATAIENARLFGEVQGYARQMALLNDITHAAISAPDLPSMMQRLADKLGELIGADGAYLTLWDPAKGAPIPMAAFGVCREIYPSLPVKPGEITLTASVLKAGKVLIVEDISKSPYISPGIAGRSLEGCLVALPLIADGKKLGAAMISFIEEHQFTPDEISLCEQAAGQIALAISKMQSLEVQRQRTTQLSRANGLIMALGHVASQIESVADPDEVMGTLGAELKKLGIYCLIALRVKESENLKVCYLSIESGIISQVEKLAGMSTREYRVSPENFPQFHAVIQDRRAIYSADMIPFFSSAQPELPSSIRRRISKIVGITHETKNIFLPLIAEEQVLGVLMMWGKDLEESDLPAAALFASQVAIAMENARLYIRTQQLAITDDLTGLYNRRGLYELGQRETDRALRFGFPISVIMLDIDHFKQINDRFGHDNGDQVLRVLADRCKRNTRSVDIVGRYGGEEFVILLSESDLKTAYQVAERLHQHVVSDPVHTDAGEVNITVSLGVSSVSEEICTLSDLIRSADQAMYKVKESGRNGVVVMGTEH